MNEKRVHIIIACIASAKLLALRTNLSMCNEPTHLSSHC